MIQFPSLAATHTGSMYQSSVEQRSKSASDGAVGVDVTVTVGAGSGVAVTVTAGTGSAVMVTVCVTAGSGARSVVMVVTPMTPLMSTAVVQPMMRNRVLDMVSVYTKIRLVQLRVKHKPDLIYGISPGVTGRCVPINSGLGVMVDSMGKPSDLMPL